MKFSSTLLVVLSAAMATFQGAAAAPVDETDPGYHLGVRIIKFSTLVMFTQTLFSIAPSTKAILFVTSIRTTGRITMMMIMSTGIAIRTLRQVSSLQVLRIFLTTMIAVLRERQ